jgi:PTHB1 N-terminus
MSQESGGVVQQRRLDKEPSCLCKYKVGGATSSSNAQTNSRCGRFHSNPPYLIIVTLISSLSPSLLPSSPPSPAPSGHNFLLASKDGTLSVYSDFNLVWAAKLSTVPVQMAVADFGGQRGLVVTLDDTGKLSVGFMGTKPPLTAVPSLTGTSANAREVDYDRLDEEHKALLQVRERYARRGRDRERE